MVNLDLCGYMGNLDIGGYMGNLEIDIGYIGKI